MGEAAVLSHCSLLRNPWPKSTGVPEHCCEGEQTAGSPFFRVFTSDHIAKVRKEVILHFYIHSGKSYKLHQRMPVKYTSEFWKLFETTKY